MNNILNLWQAEKGWEDLTKNATIIEENGMLTTENFRSVFFNLDKPINSGKVTIDLDIVTNNCFRILFSNTTDGRNPLETEINDILKQTVLLHINHYPQKHKIENGYSYSGDLSYTKVLGEGEGFGTNKHYHFTFVVDYEKKETDKFICVTLKDVEKDIILLDEVYIASIPTAYTQALAQIRVVFKTKNKNKNKTYINDFSIEYDDKALQSVAEIKTFQQLEEEYNSKIYSLDKMNVDYNTATQADVINNLAVHSKGKVLFPLYRYKKHNIYSFNTSLLNILYDGEDIEMVAYPEVDDKVKAKLSNINYSTMSKEDIIAYLLSVLNGTVEMTSEEKIEELETDYAEITVDHEFRISCLELGI